MAALIAPFEDPATALRERLGGKRVFVTGHTGFKGSWLTIWLRMLGSEVFGYSDEIYEAPSMFRAVGLDADQSLTTIGDVRDGSALGAALAAANPDVVLHLAAQPLVRKSFAEPLDTLEVNAMGTAQVLEAVRLRDKPCAVVVITSDKAYENTGGVWGYRETDPMGGSDPYSMSKGAAELIVSSWRRSFFSTPGSKCKVASGRAGNVIGGGDWAKDRIVTDCIAALTSGSPIAVRNPNATRPWQHVLEPLSGYLLLAAQLLDGAGVDEGWNFGPAADSIVPVERLADAMISAWQAAGSETATQVELDEGPHPHEASWLALNCDKSHHRLGWRPVWDFSRTVTETVSWYHAHHLGNEDMHEFTTQQIELFEADWAARNAR